MRVPNGFFEQLARSSIEVRIGSGPNRRSDPYIDDTLPIPQPFMAARLRTIKLLVIIGQDPTVGSQQNSASESTHALVLNEKKAKLTIYLGEVCAALGFSLKENVYATNLCKWFFTLPPKKLKSPKLIKEIGLGVAGNPLRVENWPCSPMCRRDQPR